MTEIVATLSPAAVQPQRLHLRARRRAPSMWGWLREPGWPLVVAFVPFPLWWALGVSELICMVMAVPMAFYLLRRRQVQVPRAFGVWLLFLCWVVVGVLVLQVSAVGAVPDNSQTRYLTWTYRLVWYLTATVTGLYVLNTRKQLPSYRVSRIVSALFLTVIAGGVLGVLAPHFEFRSLMELILPGRITSVSFVNDMIHPSAAQLQSVLGYEAPRPSAPYAYTNTWGLNFVVTLPFFIHAWLGKEAGWRRLVAPVILAVAAVVAVLSINRGMWVTLIVLALFVAIRSAMMGRPGLLAAVAVVGAAMTILVAASPLGDVVSARLSNAGSEHGRTNLSVLSVTSVAQTSPVIGLGSTRNVQGNFNTIAGGSTPGCPRCSPPALGTQGQLWLVVFSQGFVGLAAFLAFFGISFFRHLRRRSPAVTVGLLTIIASVVTMPVYDSLGTGLMVVMIGVAFLYREEAGEPRVRRLPTLGDYIWPVTRWSALVLVLAILGGIAGNEFNKVEGNPATAVVTIVVPPAPTFSLAPSSAGPMTVDTLAQLLTSDAVLSAVQRATGTRPVVGAGKLSVRATSNSRTLHISYIAKTARLAQAGAESATAAFLNERQQQLDADRLAQLRALQVQAATLNAAVLQLNTQVNTPLPGRKRLQPLWSTFSLRTQSTTLGTQQRVVDQEIADITAATVLPGFQTQATQVFFASDSRRVDLGTGLALGFLAGGLIALVLGRRGRQARRHRAAYEQTDLPILATLRPLDVAGSVDGAADSEVVGMIETAVAVHDFGSCVPADDGDATVVDVAAKLEHLVAVRRGDPRTCVIVSSDRSRTAPINRARSSAERRGMHVIGVILVTGFPKGRWMAERRPKITIGRTGAEEERESGATDRH